MTDIIIHDRDDLEFSGTLNLGTAGANSLVGTDDADVIAGGKGNDILEGAKGDDLLIGGELSPHEHGANTNEFKTDGAGADTFVFNFGVSRTVGATYYFRPNDDGTGGDTPSANANRSAWENYLEQLADWRAEMLAELGVDADAVMTGEALYTVRKTAGSLGNYDNSFSVGGSLTIDSHDGTDTILKWGDGDKLQLDGLSGLDFSDFDALFNVALNSEGDTVLSWEGGSITIDGMSITNIDAFWAAGDAGGWFA